MSALLELAERCENAVPDVGASLALVCLEDEVKRAMWALGIPPQRFLHSLDAAMDLVPEGWFLQGLSERNASGSHNWRWKAELWSPESDANVRGIARQAHAAKCAPSLALCAAALRARSELTEQEQGK